MGAQVFGWYAANVAAWFGAWGMQTVLFSWLVVGELRASPEWVGVAQTSTMLPSLLLVLFGGATADRLDPQRVLRHTHVVACAPVAMLALVILGERLSLGALLLYGASMGTVAAFAMPARDALLSRVAGSDMLRAVTGMTAAQFGALALGNLAAGAARWTGSPAMLAAQAGLLLSGAVFAARLPTAAPSGRSGSTLREIADGLREVAHTPRLRAPLALVLATGFLFVGPFLVVFPLLVRDVYGGGVDELSHVLMLFPVGTIAGSLVLRARGLRHKGRSALAALVSGAFALAAIGTGPPWPAVLAATFVWGLCGSVFINSSRTLYQEAAPLDHRARVLSVYQLGFMGASPLGALASGLVSARAGPLDALAIFAGSMLLVVAVVGTRSGIARMA